VPTHAFLSYPFCLLRTRRRPPSSYFFLLLLSFLGGCSQTDPTPHTFSPMDAGRTTALPMARGLGIHSFVRPVRSTRACSLPEPCARRSSAFFPSLHCPGGLSTFHIVTSCRTRPFPSMIPYYCLFDEEQRSVHVQWQPISASIQSAVRSFSNK
jgi:hypothetical protein